MPDLSLTTNLSLSADERQRLLPLLSEATVDAAHKPEQYVTVALHSSPDIRFAGTAPMHPRRYCDSTASPRNKSTAQNWFAL